MWILLCISDKNKEMLRDYQIDICSRVSEAFEHNRSVMGQGTGQCPLYLLSKRRLRILLLSKTPPSPLTLKRGSTAFP